MNNTHDHPHHSNIIVGDLLLHSESKTIVIQVVTPSSPAPSPLPNEKPAIRRLLPSATGTNGSQSIVSCDLKNSQPIKGTNDRPKSSSAKKLMRMHKAGLQMVKEFKSKVKTSNQAETNSVITHTGTESDRTYF